jgi:hypothetical protein
VLRFGTLVLAVCAAWTSPLASERQVLTFRTRAWLSFAPPTCRMPLGQASGCSRADPGGRGTPRFRHRLIGFRHVISGSLALASLNLACRDQVPTFPQRSPPSLLTTAARGGLRPAPDCRPRRALLHLSYSSAPSYPDGAFVTHAPEPTLPVAWKGGIPDPRRSELARKARDQAPPVCDLDRRAGKISADPLPLAIKTFRQKRLGDGIEGETAPGPDEAMVFVGNVTWVTEAPLL